MMKGEQSKPPIEIISSIKSEEEEDRISLLPDCLLIDIITRLPETKYAIRTGTLSKRWQHLWPQLPNLIICHLTYKIPQFYMSVRRIISQRGQSNLNKFQLHALYTKETKSQVNNCIHNAITRNVQEVDLHLSYYPWGDEYGFVLPDFFFISSSFIHLTLEQCIFKQAVVVSWENLKTLHIVDAELDQDVINNILSGSPLLETLMLYGCYGFEQLDITNRSVKNLVLSVSLRPYAYSVEINAPYVLTLSFRGYLLLRNLVLLNVSSVIKAKLNYHNDDIYDGHEMYEEEEKMLKGLLLSLDHVKEVKIGKLCLKAVAGLKAKGFIFPSNVKVRGEIDSS